MSHEPFNEELILARYLERRFGMAPTVPAAPKTKSDASIRTVPVHPDLLPLGFKEWIEGLRAADAKRLFPAATWKPWTRTGHPGSAASIRSGKPLFSRFKRRAYRPSSRPRWWVTSWTTSTTPRIAANSPPTRNCMGPVRTPQDWRYLNLA